MSRLSWLDFGDFRMSSSTRRRAGFSNSSRPNNPSISPDLDAALRDMVTFAEDELPEASPARSEDHATALGAGLGRIRVAAAESTARTTDLDHVPLSRGKSKPSSHRSREAGPKSSSSPGLDRMSQPQSALRFGISRRLGGRRRVSAARIPLGRAARVFGGCHSALKDQWYAFSFGVAFYDVDAFLATRPPRRAGRLHTTARA